jgi:ankyrin repeat protein
VHKLLDLGANPHLTGGNLVSALHAAAQAGKVDIVRRLLDREGVDVNLVAGKYGHILQATCKPRSSVSVNFMGCLRLLVERGSDVNARGGKFETALQCAARYGHLDAVLFLLDHGADPTVEGGKFKTASEAAREKKHWHVFNYLERYIRLGRTADICVIDVEIVYST